MALGPIPDREPLAEATSRTMTPRWVLWLTSYVQAIQALAAGVKSGTGSPNGAVVGDVSDVYRRKDGGAGTSFYVKESGAGTNTGWVGK